MDDFDPYQSWLGIEPDEGPPNHYRLLGLPNFEASGDAIRDAADQRMAQIRRFQTGPRGMHTQRVLNELAAAKLCLLDSRMKATYDAVIRGQLDALRNRDLDDRWGDSEELPPTVGDADDDPLSAPPPPPVPVQPATPVVPATGDALTVVTIQAEPRVPRRSNKGSRKDTRKSNRLNNPTILGVGGVVLVGLIIVIAMSVGGSGDSDNPSKDRQPGANKKSGNTGGKKSQQNARGRVVKPNADGTIELLPETATLNGTSISVGSLAGESVITNWAKDESVTWEFESSTFGFHRLRIQYAADSAQVDSVYEVQIDDGKGGKSKAPRIREATGGRVINEYTIMPIPKRGRHTITIRPKKMTSDRLMKLKSIRLEKISG